jgi:HEAT repeat protein
MFALAAIGHLVRDLPELREEVPLLLEKLDDPDGRVRANAIFALGKVGPAARGTVSRLLSGIPVDDDHARAGLLESLALIAPDDPDVLALAASLLGASSFVVAERAASLFRAGAGEELRRTTVRAVAEKLASRDVAERGEALRAARWLADGSFVGPLIAQLEDADLRVRLGAAHALAAIGPGASPAVPLLVTLIRREMPEAIALSRKGQYAGDTLACALLRTIGRIGPAAVAAAPVAAELLESGAIDVVWSAADALEGMGLAASNFAAGVRRAFERCMEGEGGEGRRWALRSTLAKALCAVDADRVRVVQVLAPFLEEDPCRASQGRASQIPYQDFRINIVRLLGSMGRDALVAVPKLRSLADHWHLDEAVKEALAALTGGSGGPASD